MPRVAENVHRDDCCIGKLFKTLEAMPDEKLKVFLDAWDEGWEKARAAATK